MAFKIPPFIHDGLLKNELFLPSKLDEFRLEVSNLKLNLRLKSSIFVDASVPNSPKKNFGPASLIIAQNEAWNLTTHLEWDVTTSPGWVWENHLCKLYKLKA